MSKPFVVQHHLDQLSLEELVQYLREMSAYIGLDPDLNGLDIIWMDNMTGVGRTLVPYAKRGTAEILRNLYKIDVEELSHIVVKGSIVFTAAGRNGHSGRVERAVGSKYIEGLIGKALDDAIMTASTRALRRLTMQFTTLGILDESEVVDIVGQPVNPAASATLAGSPIVIPPMPSVAPNNAPGKPVEPSPEILKPQTPIESVYAAFKRVQASITDMSVADTQQLAKLSDAPVSPTEQTTSTAPEEDKKADKKPRKKKNTVSLEVEPEVVNKTVQPATANEPEGGTSGNGPIATPLSPSPSAPPPAPVPPPQPPAPPVESPVVSAAGQPSKEQMDGYRKKIGVYTQQLPATPGNGSVQRMRAFITKMTDGAAPQNMTVVQWEKLLAWFDDFAGRNGVKGLLAYINDTLGDVPKSK